MYGMRSKSVPSHCDEVFSLLKWKCNRTFYLFRIFRSGSKSMQGVECLSFVRILHQLPIFLGKSPAAHMPTVAGITAFTNLATDFFANTSLNILFCHSS